MTSGAARAIRPRDRCRPPSEPPPGGEDPLWRALLLVVVAGFVDAVGFLALAGTFVAFMSGNTSAGGALAGTLDLVRASRQLFPLPLFVAGIYAGALAVQAVPPEERRRRYALVLAAEGGLIAVVLVAASAAGVRGAVPLDPPARFFGLAAPLALAMGLQNAMRVDVRGANLATTYVTGTLHVAAQALARAPYWPGGRGVIPEGRPCAPRRAEGGRWVSPRSACGSASWSGRSPGERSSLSPG